jgi:hypothetical protein
MARNHTDASALALVTVLPNRPGSRSLSGSIYRRLRFANALDTCSTVDLGLTL